MYKAEELAWELIRFVRSVTSRGYETARVHLNGVIIATVL